MICGTDPLTTYTYDKAYQLQSSEKYLQLRHTYTYDPAGNVTSYGAYDAANQLASGGGVTSTYDGAGNLQLISVGATRFINAFHTAFPDPPPFNVVAVASLRGLHWSDDDPRFSPDSEIAPESDGRVVLRVNKRRPLTRQRFSICHEIGHTLFPDYQLAVRCRKASDRTFADPADLLETLCDVAASELMFPSPWFTDRVSSMQLSVESVSNLAAEYQASRDATVRRLVEQRLDPLVAVYFSWKLKPTEQRTVRRNRNARPLFPDMPIELPEPMLRVDYAVTNSAFDARCTDHIPKDKSVPSDGPIYAASATQSGVDGDVDIDLGTLQGRFRVHALPIFTPADALGPEQGSSVVAILRPTE